MNGDGTGKRTHLSLFIVIMKGEYDALLPWPFRNKVRTKGNIGGEGEGRVLQGLGKPESWSRSWFSHELAGDLGKSLALSMLSAPPFIKQKPEFTSSSQGFLQHHESRGKNGWTNILGGM